MKKTIETWMMQNAKSGDVFYSDKMDNHLTAMANYHKRTIKTERLLTVSPVWEDQSTTKVTRITFLQ